MTESKMAERIEKLLRKAEDAEGPEAEAFVAKAQELMTEYAIDEAMLARAKKGRNETPEEVVQEVKLFSGRYRKPLMQLAVCVAHANWLRPIYTKWPSGLGRKLKSSEDALYWNGLGSDVRRADILYSSLAVQAQAAMQDWWKNEADEWLKSVKREGFYARREFMFSYARRVAMRLNQARREVEARKETEAAADDNNSNGVALALQDKEARVEAWIDEKYGKLGTKRSGRRRGGARSAADAGTAAGARADLGGGRVGSGSRGALPA